MNAGVGFARSARRQPVCSCETAGVSFRMKSELSFARSWRPRMIAGGLIVVAVSFAIVLVVLASIRPLTSLETVLLQILIFGAGLSGSFWLGRSSATESAREVIRPHARSAIRTILSWHDSLFRLSVRIEDYKEIGPDARLDIIQSIINEQIPIGRSAVEGWRDIVPNDVDEVIARWTEEQRV